MNYPTLIFFCIWMCLKFLILTIVEMQAIYELSETSLFVSIEVCVLVLSLACVRRLLLVHLFMLVTGWYPVG